MAARRTPDQVTEAKQQIAILLRAGVYLQEICRQTALPETSVRRWADLLGLPIQKCRSGPKQGAEHPEWSGGRTYDKHGYVQIWMPLHPQANNSGRCWEHRTVAEVANKRYLLPNEVVNHEDDHPRHNWPSNLTVFASNAEHLRYELTGKPSATSKGGARPSPRASIPGAYRSIQKLHRCPDEHETLAQCPSETRLLIAHFVESHRPTPEHRTIPRRKLRGLGAHRDPWILPSTE
jgi:hypothetical protein